MSSLQRLEGHIPNKISIPLQSLISCFLEPPRTGEWQRVQLRGSAEATPQCPEGSTILCALEAVTQAGGGSSGFNLLCAKDQANENCEHRSGI